jgi:hypothetical protein
LAYDHRLSEEDVRFDPWAEYAVVTAESGTGGIEFRRVPFDPNGVIALLQRSTIPYAQNSIAMWRTR